MSNSITQNMQIDIGAMPAKDDWRFLFNKYPELKRLKTWYNYNEHSSGVEIGGKKLLTYLVILYSEDSFLNLRNPLPLGERKAKALKLSGLNGEDDNVMSKLIMLFDEYIVAMIQEFLVYQHSILWTEICTTEQQYEEAIRLRFNPVTEKGDEKRLKAAELKKKLREECKIMMNDLESYYSKFYRDHQDVETKVKEFATSLESIAKSASDI